MRVGSRAKGRSQTRGWVQLCLLGGGKIKKEVGCEVGEWEAASSLLRARNEDLAGPVCESIKVQATESNLYLLFISAAHEVTRIPT